MKTFTVYRVTNQFYVTYKPVIRNGKPVTYKSKALAEMWLEMHPPKSTSTPPATFEVRRTIKEI